MPSFLSDLAVIDNLRLGLSYLLRTSFVWLPVITTIALLRMWLNYRRAQFWASQGYTLLEIKLPKIIEKSPVAMEVINAVFFQTGGETTWINRWWEGKTRPWFSLELVSLGGIVKFYIWTRPQLRNIIESQIYSQIPGIEIYEVEDYTLPFAYDPEKNAVWGCEWKLTQLDAFPIKTYTDYGLDSPLIVEERKVDPMTPSIEFLGSLTEGHNAWVQIIVRAHKKEQRKKGTLFEKTDKWKDEALSEIKKLQEKTKGTPDKPGLPLTEGDKEKMKALEKSLSKNPYDVGMRSIYIADKEKFNSANIAGLTGMFKQFGSPNLNGFAPTGGLTGFDYPWQDWSGRKREHIKKRLIEAYKFRQYFYPPFKEKPPFVLNSEELATLYHFPGGVALTPTLERVPSKKSEAPFNLPT
jgi:hypothetical protein